MEWEADVLEKLRSRRQSQSPLRPRAFLLHKIPPDTFLISSRLTPAGLQAAGGVGWEKWAQKRKWGSLLIDSPPAGCGRSSIPKDPAHCPPGAGGKRVTFEKRSKKAVYTSIHHP